MPLFHLKPVIKNVMFNANEHTFFFLHRHHLECTFHSDSEAAMLEADVIGVVHDVSNTWTRDRLDPKVLRLLYLYPKKHSFLILNKVRFISCGEDCHELPLTNGHSYVVLPSAYLILLCATSLTLWGPTSSYARQCSLAQGPTSSLARHVISLCFLSCSRSSCHLLCAV